MGENDRSPRRLSTRLRRFKEPARESRHFLPVSTSWTGWSYHISMYIASCRRDTWRHRSPETTKVDTNRRFTIARSVAACKLPGALMHGHRSVQLEPGRSVWERYIVASPQNLAMMYCTFQLSSEKRENCVPSASVSVYHRIASYQPPVRILRNIWHRCARCHTMFRLLKIFSLSFYKLLTAACRITKIMEAFFL